MTHTLIIETQNDTDFALLKELAHRLGYSTDERHTDGGLSTSEQAKLLEGLRWEGDETGDELAAMIQNARQDSPRDVQL